MTSKTVRLRSETIELAERLTNLPPGATFSDKVHDVIARCRHHLDQDGEAA